MHAKKQQKYVDHLYSNRYTFDMACHYNRYSGKPNREITIWNNQKTLILVCGALLQLLHNMVLSCLHIHSGVPHDAIVVAAFVGMPLQLDAGIGDCSVKEPHHIYSVTTPGKNFDAAPAPTLLYSQAKFLKWTKV
jgi:hypothetical protein